MNTQDFNWQLDYDFDSCVYYKETREDKVKRFNEPIRDFREETWVCSIIFILREIPTPGGHKYQWSVFVKN